MRRAGHVANLRKMLPKVDPRIVRRQFDVQQPVDNYEHLLLVLLRALRECVLLLPFLALCSFIPGC